MERVLEVDELQAQHFPTVHSLIDLTKQQEQSITEMSHHIKQLQNSKMSDYIESLHKVRNDKTVKESDIIEKGQQLVL
jgi:hypothetical protein